MNKLLYKLWYSFGKQTLWECGMLQGKELEIKIEFKTTRGFNKYCKLKDLVFTDKFYEGKTNDEIWDFVRDFVRCAEMFGGKIGKESKLKLIE